MDGGRLQRLRDTFGLDLRALGVLRGLLGLMLLVDLAVRAEALVAHYTDAGLLPRPLQAELYLDRIPGRYSLHMWTGDAVGIGALFVLAAVCALLLLVGLHTRLMLLLSLVLLTSLHNRNEMIETGGDTLLRLVCFWGLFLPLDARFSVDALRGRGAVATPAGAPSAPRMHLSAASFALIAQLTYVYVFSAVHKNHAHWRQDFLALHYALHIDAYATPLGEWLRQYRDVTRALTRVTLVFEYAGPALIWGVGLLSQLPGLSRLGRLQGPVRTAGVLVFMGFHLLLGSFLALGTFPWFAMLIWVSVMPAWGIERLGPRLLPAALRERALTWGQQASSRMSALFAPRPQLQAPTPRPTVGVRRALGVVGQAVAGVAIVYVTLWNLRTVDSGYAGYINGRAAPVLPNMTRVMTALRLDQHWGLFAPYPRTKDGYYVVLARTADGEQLDLLSPAQKLTWQKPRYVSSSYPTFRWRKYYRNIRRGGRRYQRQRQALLEYYCRRENAQRPADRRIETLDLYFMRMKTLRIGGYNGPRKDLIAHRTCARSS